MAYGEMHPSETHIKLSTQEINHGGGGRWVLANQFLSQLKNLCFVDSGGVNSGHCQVLWIETGLNLVAR